MFSYFGAGSFLGNALMGLTSDLLPIRSPIYEVGIIISTILVFLLTSLHSQAGITIVSFFLGAVLFGSTIIIAAIECDMGNYVKAKYNLTALGTFSGFIDGFASLGSVLSQVIIGAVQTRYGWNTTFGVLAVIIGIAGLPSI